MSEKDQRRLKILHITRNLPPLLGGMEKLNWHMANQLSKSQDVVLIGPKEAAKYAPPSVRFCGIQLKPLWYFIFGCFWITLRKAFKQRPDIIFAGSGLTAPIAWAAAKICRTRSAAYLHGLDITVNNIFYQSLWLPAIKRADIVIANSSYTARLATEIGVPEGRISVVHPGVDIPKKKASISDITAFRTNYSLGATHILLSVGRLAERKGIVEFVRNSLPDIIKSHPDTTLAIIGEEPNESLGSKPQRIAAIQSEAEKLGIGPNVRFLGRVDENTLQVAYQASSVHVFPVKYSPIDPEGFGMVSIEAAAQGLPTVAFASGGIVDAVSNGASGFLVESGNYADFSQKVINVIENESKLSLSSQKFARTFSWDKHSEKLTTILSKIRR